MAFGLGGLGGCVATILNAGRPGEISTSTSTITPSSPTTAQVLDLASICSRAEEPIGDAMVRSIAATVKRPEPAVAGYSTPVSRLVRREDGSTTEVALLGEPSELGAIILQAWNSQL